MDNIAAHPSQTNKIIRISGCHGKGQQERFRKRAECLFKPLLGKVQAGPLFDHLGE